MHPRLSEIMTLEASLFMWEFMRLEDELLVRWKSDSKWLTDNITRMIIGSSRLLLIWISSQNNKKKIRLINESDERKDDAKVHFTIFHSRKISRLDAPTRKMPSCHRLPQPLPFSVQTAYFVVAFYRLQNESLAFHFFWVWNGARLEL